MTTFRLTLLGRFQLHQDGINITTQLPKKARALLAYLAVTEQPQERTILAGLLWSDYPENRARKNLRDVLSLLRRELAPWLIITRQTVELTETAVSHTDVHIFLTSIKNPMRLTQGLALYKGDFLNGLYVSKAHLFEEWVISEREYLRQQAIMALQAAAENCIKQHDIAAGLTYAQQLLQLDSWRESAHQLMIRLLQMDGDTSAALKQYEICCQILETELGVDPSPETIKVYTAIRDSKSLPELLPRSSFLSGFLPPHNLPREQTRFIGREVELAQLDLMLNDEVTRLVTIVGAGGMGKTRLALAFARQQVANGRFPDGVFFMPLVSLTDGSMLAPAIAHSLNLPLETGLQRRLPPQQVQDFLRSKKLLLVLDSYEHLIDTAHFLASLLQAAPGIKIIVTSRQRLNISMETSYTLKGLDYPDWQTSAVQKDFENALKYSGISLFWQSARRVQPGYEIETADLEAISRICQLVQGMPLGILLAATWIEMLTFEEVAAEIEGNLDFLETDLQDIPKRQHSIRIIFDYTWTMLAEAEQEMFSKLSVFRGGFTRDAAHEVTGISLHMLKIFKNKSLLQRNPDNGRYEIHELLRKYAEEKLTLAIKLTETRRDHLDYFLQIGQEAERALLGSDQVDWLNFLERDLENLRAALHWSGTVDVDKGLKLVTALWMFWMARGHLNEADAWITKLLKHIENGSLALKAKALCVQSDINMNQYNFDLAYTQAKEGLTLYRSINDLKGVAQALNHLAHTLISQKREPDRMVTMVTESLSIFRRADDWFGIADSLELLGEFELSIKNNYDGASKYWHTALSICEQNKHLIGMGNIYSRLGSLALGQGNLIAARDWIEKDISIKKQVGMLGTAAYSLQLMGNIYARLGDYEQACRYLVESITLAQDTGISGAVLWGTVQLGYAYLGLGEISQAQETFSRSLQQFRKFDILDGIAFTLEGFAKLAMMADQPERAVRLFAQADAVRVSAQDSRPPAEQAQVDQTTADIKELIGSSRYANAYDEGKAMTVEQAISLLC